MNIDDCVQDVDCELVESHIEIVDISPSICNGELVDITVEGVIPIDTMWGIDFFGNIINVPTPQFADCFLNYNSALLPGWNWEIRNDGATKSIDVGIYDDDGMGGYDEIGHTLITATSKISMYDTDNNGDCLSVPFKYTFSNVDLSTFMDGIDNDVELYAAAAGYPGENLEGSKKIGEFGDFNGEDFYGYRSPEYSVDVDTDPPPTPDPDADPDSWTMITTPNILGYAVVDSGSGVDHYEYRIFVLSVLIKLGKRACCIRIIYILNII
jgi:hypothetical protein